MPRFLGLIFKKKKSKPATVPEKTVEPVKPVKPVKSVEPVKPVGKVEESSPSKVGLEDTGSIIKRSTNSAFQEAWKQHWNDLSEHERNAWSFQDVQAPLQVQKTMEDVDKLHREQSVARRIGDRTLTFLQVVDSVMAGASFAIEAAPQVTSIVVGVIRIVIGVCNCLFDS